MSNEPGRPHVVVRPEEWTWDWNVAEGADPLAAGVGALHDETLRDGLQSPSAIDPPLEKKLALVRQMDALGIGSVCIGLPGAGPRAKEDCAAIARLIREEKLRIIPGCAARTVVADVAAIADVTQATGQPLEVYAFIGSSPIRQYAENWTLDHLLTTSATAIDFARSQNLEVSYVTEDTTRTPPRVLDRLFRNAIEHGARRLTLCDTTGHATPEGTRNLVRWARGLVRGLDVDVKLDFHGHNDRGLAVTNALAALAAGADRVHGCALGMGERVGNAAIDLVILNLYLLGRGGHRLERLVDYVRAASEALGFEVPHNYPLSGLDAFRTATGVHAAAIVKAKALGDEWLVDRVYSSVPARVFGQSQQIDIGPMSGASNVRFWLEARGIVATEGLVQAILQTAKQTDHTLSEPEIRRVIAAPAP